MKSALITGIAGQDGSYLFDPIYTRPVEVDVLIGDYSLANEHLGWKPVMRMTQLAHLMTDADMELARRGFHDSANMPIDHPYGQR